MLHITCLSQQYFKTTLCLSILPSIYIYIYIRSLLLIAPLYRTFSHVLASYCHNDLQVSPARRELTQQMRPAGDRQQAELKMLPKLNQWVPWQAVIFLLPCCKYLQAYHCFGMHVRRTCAENKAIAYSVKWLVFLKTASHQPIVFVPVPEIGGMHGNITEPNI